MSYVATVSKVIGIAFVVVECRFKSDGAVYAINTCDGILNEFEPGSELGIGGLDEYTELSRSTTQVYSRSSEDEYEWLVVWYDCCYAEVRSLCPCVGSYVPSNPTTYDSGPHLKRELLCCPENNCDIA
jgi:hypothetical protein